MIREGAKEGTVAPGRGLWLHTGAGYHPQFFTGEDADGSRETRILGVLPQPEAKQNRLGCIHNSGRATAMKMPRPTY